MTFARRCRHDIYVFIAVWPTALRSSSLLGRCMSRESGKSELIRAWEEELVRIEKASRRSSNVLAFWRRRDKSPKGPAVLKTRIAA